MPAGIASLLLLMKLRTWQCSLISHSPQISCKRFQRHLVSIAYLHSCVLLNLLVLFLLLTINKYMHIVFMFVAEVFAGFVGVYSPYSISTSLLLLSLLTTVAAFSHERNKTNTNKGGEIMKKLVNQASLWWPKHIKFYIISSCWLVSVLFSSWLFPIRQNFIALSMSSTL